MAPKATTAQGGRQPNQRTSRGTTHDATPRAFRLTDGRWRAQRTVNGKRYTTTRKTAGDAEQALVYRLQQIKHGIVITRKTDPTIDTWLWDYHREISSGDGAISAKTEANYRSIIKSILRPEYKLTGTKLTELTTEKIITFRHAIEANPNLGPGSRKKIEVRLKTSLEAAAERGLITHNPYPSKTDKNAQRRRNQAMREVDAKRQSEEEIKRKINYYPQAILKYLEEKSDHQTYLLYALSFFAVRPAEVRGLTLDKFNHLKHTLLIDQQLDNQGNLRQHTKTEAGTRTLWLPPKLHEMVKAQVNSQKKLGRKYLFTDDRGKPLRQAVHNRKWHEITAQVFPNPGPNEKATLRLYANRHMATTILDYAKIDYPVICSITGWSTRTGTMLDTYSHKSYGPNSPETQDAMKLLEAKLWKLKLNEQQQSN
jgi:hypothetical protein